MVRRRPTYDEDILEPARPGTFINELPPHKRALLVPDAKLLIAIPKGRDRLVLRRLDLEAVSRSWKVTTPVLLSDPPVAAPLGQVYTYPLRVKVAEGDAQFALQNGPAGMQIKDGVLTWNVPAWSLAPSIGSAFLAGGRTIRPTGVLPQGRRECARRREYGGCPHATRH